MANKPIEFDSEAADEVVDGYEWYLKRSPQAARAFLSEVDRAIDAIQASPAMFATYARHTTILAQEIPIRYRLPRTS